MQRRATAMAIAAVALLGVLASACTGETTVHTGAGGQGISVTGVGRVAVEPDVAILSLGVEVQATTVSRARSGAAEAMQDVRDSLAANGVEERDIQTLFFNIFPQFDFERRTPEIIGFTVSTQVEIKVRDIDTVSDVLDDAITAGGDAIRVNGIRFSVDEPEQFFGEARRLAGEDARERAEQLADLAGVRLGKAISISESSGGGGIPIPLAAFDARDEAFGGASIAPGEGEIVLGRQPVDDNVFRQGFRIDAAGDYIVSAAFEAGGELHVLDFPLRVGARPPVGPAGIAALGALLALIAVAVIQRRRVLTGKLRAAHDRRR